MPDLIVGSCLQGPEDADRLAAAGVTTVYSLQVGPWRARCGHLLLANVPKGCCWVLCVSCNHAVCASIANWFCVRLVRAPDNPLHVCLHMCCRRTVTWSTLALTSQPSRSAARRLASSTCASQCATLTPSEWRQASRRSRRCSRLHLRHDNTRVRIAPICPSSWCWPPHAAPVLVSCWRAVTQRPAPEAAQGSDSAG